MSHEGKLRKDDWFVETTDFRTGPYPRWVDPNDGGKQVATLATRTRTKAEMVALGYVCQGSFYKHKFTMHL